MTNGKVSRGSPFNVTHIDNTSTKSQDPASQHGSHRAPHGHFKGALFQHGALSILMRRGPIGRMPLRNAGKRSGAPNRTRSNQDVQDVGFLLDGDDHLLEESAADRLALRFKSFQEHDEQGPSDDRGGERRFARMFQMPATQSSAIASGKSGTATHDAAQAALVAVPLPSMSSLRDVVSFIHTCTLKDPTGKSISQILRRVNAAVLRKEIDVPVITKFADARDVLIEIFGVAQMSKESANPSMRSLHLQLPLWLVNLGRHRTSEQRVEAAARVSSQRAVLDMK